MIAALSFSEFYGLAFFHALERRGYCEIPSKYCQDHWALADWTNSLLKMNISCDVAFFGNSITRGSDFQQYFPELKIVNLGYSGDILLRMKNRVPMLKAVNPKKIFIMGGTNDIFHVKTETIIDRYERLLDAIVKSMPNSKIYIQSILPVNTRILSSSVTNDDIIKTNEAIKSMCERRGLKYIDVFSSYYIDGQMPEHFTPDGLHLKKDAYAKWYDTIKDSVVE